MSNGQNMIASDEGVVGDYAYSSASTSPPASMNSLSNTAGKHFGMDDVGDKDWCQNNVNSNSNDVPDDLSSQDDIPEIELIIRVSLITISINEVG